MGALGNTLSPHLTSTAAITQIRQQIELKMLIQLMVSIFRVKTHYVWGTNEPRVSCILPYSGKHLREKTFADW